MKKLNEEQQKILETIKTGKNVIVDSVAGTGKTTMILSVAEALPEMRILQITYNSSLKDDVRKRVTESGLKNMEIHTFHSLMKSYYLNDGYSDTDIHKVLSKNLGPYRVIPKFDIVVSDEAQDTSLLYFEFLAKFISDLENPIQLIVLGDYMQGLYDFKGADIRFLTLTREIWSGFSYLRTQEFEKCTMKTSFRITNQMCLFLNNVMLGEERMKACKDGPTVVYIRYPIYDAMKIVYGEILKLFEKGVLPGEIFVLAGSVKGSNSKIMKLENALVEREIPCHVPLLDGDKIDERVIGGKIVFSTFHSSKGRERKYVFVVGFDYNSMLYFTRDVDKFVCPNSLYVGVTRATERLYLLENDQYDTDQPLKFLKMSHLEMKKTDYIDFRGMHKSIFKTKELVKQYDKMTPTELLRFIPESIINDLVPLLDKIFISEQKVLEEIEIPSVIETKEGLFEEISDLNGIAIPAIYYDHIKAESGSLKKSVLLEVIDEYLSVMKENEHMFLRKIINDLPSVLGCLSDYLFAANISIAVQEKLYFKLNQIKRDEYNWLDEKLISFCLVRLQKTLGKECSNTVPRVEETIIQSTNESLHEKMDIFLKEAAPSLPKIRFSARTDLITKSVIWEMKCTKTLTVEHKLQLVIYAWIIKMRYNKPDEDSKKAFKLFNIRTGELLRLEASMNELNHIMLTLLKAKYNKKVIKTDDEFISDCRSYLASI